MSRTIFTNSETESKSLLKEQSSFSDEANYADGEYLMPITGLEDTENSKKKDGEKCESETSSISSEYKHKGLSLKWQTDSESESEEEVKETDVPRGTHSTVRKYDKTLDRMYQPQEYELSIDEQFYDDIFRESEVSDRTSAIENNRSSYSFVIDGDDYIISYVSCQRFQKYRINVNDFAILSKNFIMNYSESVYPYLNNDSELDCNELLFVLQGADFDLLEKFMDELQMKLPKDAIFEVPNFSEVEQEQAPTVDIPSTSIYGDSESPIVSSDLRKDKDITSTNSKNSDNSGSKSLACSVTEMDNESAVEFALEAQSTNEDTIQDTLTPDEYLMKLNIIKDMNSLKCVDEKIEMCGKQGLTEIEEFGNSVREGPDGGINNTTTRDDFKFPILSSVKCENITENISSSKESIQKTQVPYKMVSSFSDTQRSGITTIGVREGTASDFVLEEQYLSKVAIQASPASDENISTHTDAKHLPGGSSGMMQSTAGDNVQEIPRKKSKRHKKKKKNKKNVLLH